MLMQKRQQTTAKKMDRGAEAAATVKKKKASGLVCMWRTKTRMEQLELLPVDRSWQYWDQNCSLWRS